MASVKDQLRWQVWAYRLSEGSTHFPGITLHTLYLEMTPALSGIRMSLYYRPRGYQFLLVGECGTILFIMRDPAVSFPISQ